MDPSRFDQISKILVTRRLSRRSAVAGGAGGVGAGLLAAVGARAKQAPPIASPVAKSADNRAFLFVQTAMSGSFVPNPKAGAGATPAAGTPMPRGQSQPGQFLLTLNGHVGETIYFSDRPDRVFGEAQTDKFLAGLGFTPANPPNAALIADTPEQEDDVLIVELLNPTWKTETGTLTYEANVLSQYQGEGLKHIAQQQKDDTIAPQFGHASLFIDDCADQVWGGYPRSGGNPNGAVGFITIGACWSTFGCFCCDWSNCSGNSDPDSLCNQNFRGDCGDQGCLACTTSPITVATGGGGTCL
jgi:hypothetical protein